MLSKTSLIKAMGTGGAIPVERPRMKTFSQKNDKHMDEVHRNACRSLQLLGVTNEY